MRIPQNLKEHYRIIEKERIDIDGLFNDFSISSKEKYLRKYLAPLLKYFPTGMRYFITDIAKYMRNPSRKAMLNYPMDFEENRLIASMLNETLKPWWGKKAVLCLSHDVDNNIGYSFTQTMAKMNRDAGISATFNFLTHDNYTPDLQLLHHLEDMGMEIGLHGYTHDQGFAYRSKKKIQKKLTASLSLLKGIKITGMRTPALSKSKNFFSSITETKLKYDSSMQIGSDIYHSVRLPYPYYLEEYGIWEIPLMIQDDNYLRDSNTNEDEILLSIMRFINETISLNGVMVLNMHPHLMYDRKELYNKILDTVLENKNELSFATTGKICDYI